MALFPGSEDKNQTCHRPGPPEPQNFFAAVRVPVVGPPEEFLPTHGEHAWPVAFAHGPALLAGEQPACFGRQRTQLPGLETGIDDGTAGADPGGQR